ncbi:hypothetical protein [Plantactinospora endophytica]|uniref:hypothetical protein n=1 Tax=Plantactinospora endophytica TaxID=673535 RepID=UPI001EF1BAD9|nr:hypothetical protein [Plantactinospora endophytica]
MLRLPSPDRTTGRRRAVGAPLARLAAPLALAGCLTLTAACGVPPELEQPQATPTRPTPSPTATASGVPTPGPSLPATPTPSPSGLAACPGGRPSRDQVIALLRRTANLPRSGRVTFDTGPLCVEDWQYSVVSMADREPLQAVTRGRPGNLRLVTAGSDVCNITVRAEAPPILRTRVCDAPPPFGGGL